MASADFSLALTEEISPGKVPKLSARAARLYLVCLSVTVGFRGSQHTHRPHPASLSVRVPTVVPLLDAAFRLTSRFPPCASLRLSSLLPVTSLQVTSFGPCRAHWEPACRRREIPKPQTAKIPDCFQSGILSIGAWRCPTLTWGDPTLPSALNRFTTEFGMVSGGSNSLWSPSKKSKQTCDCL